MVKKIDTREILALLDDGENGPSKVSELYHALIEYIKSGNAIPDMGHPDFALGACGNADEKLYSSYKPSTCTVFQLAQTFSRYTSNFDMPYTWYRSLSTWQEFCKFVAERAQIDNLRRNFRKTIKSHNYYFCKTECPACGARRRDFFLDIEDEVYVKIQERLVLIDCRRCGKYRMSFPSFNFLYSNENKAKLFVFLFTRTDKKKR